MIKVSRSLKELSYRIFQTREDDRRTGKRADAGRTVTGDGSRKRRTGAGNGSLRRLNLCIVRSIKKKEVRFRFWTSWKKKRTPGRENSGSNAAWAVVGKIRRTGKNLDLSAVFCGKTQSAVGKEMGISQVQVSRMEKKIIQNLREMTH